MEENSKDHVEEPNKEEKDNWTSIKGEVLSWIKMLATAIVIAFILRTFVFQMALVNQKSMEPTLIEGQMLVIAKINYLLGDPQRGDIIVLKDDVENILLIKRVIGLPGETVQLKEGKVFVNGEELKDYTNAPTYSASQDTWTISEGKYFVLGDNRENSRDSRAENVGLVERSAIVGRAVFRVWPSAKLGLLK